MTIDIDVFMLTPFGGEKLQYSISDASQLGNFVRTMNDDRTKFATLLDAEGHLHMLNKNDLYTTKVWFGGRKDDAEQEGQRADTSEVGGPANPETVPNSNK